MKLLILHFLKKRIFSRSLFRLIYKFSNQNQLLPSGFKLVLNIMATEQGLCAQLVMICRKYSENKWKRKIRINMTSEGNLQDQYAGLILIIIG